jgi:toxin ParE1/3/4
MPKVRVTPPAEADLVAIAEYTIEYFGARQAAIYRDGLLEAMAMLADNPFMGLDQDHIKPNTRRLVHQRHSIYYKIRQDEVLVLRILGPGQDPTRQLR